MKFPNQSLLTFLAATAMASSGGIMSVFAQEDCQSIVDVACGLENFSTLCTAVQLAGLEGPLSDPDSHWTVFAPTNDAFSELGSELLDTVLADPEGLLTDILLFHAVPNEVVTSSDLFCSGLVEMANGQDSRTVCVGSKIFQKGGSNPRNDMPEIIQADIPTCQGVIHVVDEVMLPGRLVASSPTPPPKDDCQTIAQIACGLDDFSTLCSAVQLAGLGDALGGGHWTVFAPTNAAFEKLGSELLDTVLADIGLLSDILLFHAVSDRVVFASDLECMHTIHMANGDDSRHVCANGSVFQKGAGNPRSDMPQIETADVGACNGVIHIIDEVMLP